MITPDMIRDQLALAGISQRKAADLLRLRQVQINEREFRHYCTGRSNCPDVVYRALRDLVSNGELT